MSAAKVSRERIRTWEAVAEREDERRRLARELHDGPAQAMAAALFGVDLALAALERKPQDAREELRRAREQVREALFDVRNLMSGLRPRVLEERGLIEALRSLAGDPALWGPEVSVAISGSAAVDHLPNEIELALYRVAQEATSNARRHSGASKIEIELGVQAGAVRLTVRDDGNGPPKRPPLEIPGSGAGISGMRERAAHLGGTFTLEQAPGGGTIAEIVLPLPNRINEARGET